jgi:glycine betaine/choline ABC-type transport system substrate-binding protein
MYKAVEQKEVDLICAFLTDGRILAYKLRPLEDDKGFFPPYYAAPVIRGEVLQAYPELEEVLNLLGGKIDDETMQDLNYQVDEKGLEPADIVLEFLIKKGLLKDKIFKTTFNLDAGMKVTGRKL